MNFREHLNEVKYNYDIHGDGNPYKGLDKTKLEKKKKAFTDIISDARSKLQPMMGAKYNKGLHDEIDEYQLKLDQVNYFLKGK